MEVFHFQWLKNPGQQYFYHLNESSQAEFNTNKYLKPQTSIGICLGDDSPQSSQNEAQFESLVIRFYQDLF